jgi:hypothetical protein
METEHLEMFMDSLYEIHESHNESIDEIVNGKRMCGVCL